MWLTTWKTTHVDVPTVMAKAKAAGLTSLWVRTGGSKQGYYGDPLLHAMLPAAHAAGLKVIAWDFPAMSNPARDAIRARAALKYTVDGQKIDGFSPDIETINEGTFNNPQAGLLLPVPRTARRPRSPGRGDGDAADGRAAEDVTRTRRDGPVHRRLCTDGLLVVPRAGALTERSIQALAQFGKPVTVIGQAYDMAGRRWPAGDADGGGDLAVPGQRQAGRRDRREPVDVRGVRPGAVGAAVEIRLVASDIPQFGLFGGC